MNERPRKGAGSRWTKRVLLSILGAFVLFIAFDFDWSGRGKRPPIETIYYDGHQWRATPTRYLRSRGLDIKDVPSDENAALDYLIAGELMPPPRLADREARRLADVQERYVTRYGWIEECSLLWSYVNGAQPALERARIGLAKTQALWPIQLEGGVLSNAFSRGLGGAPQLGRAFVWRGFYAAWDGNDEEALESFLAPIQIGNHLASGSSLMHGLVGLAVNEMGFDALERWVLSGPPEPLLRRALIRVRALEPTKPNYAHALHCERAEAMDYVRFYGKLNKNEVMGGGRLSAIEGPIFGRSRTLRGIARRRANAVFDRTEQWLTLNGRARHSAAADLNQAINKAFDDWYTQKLWGFLSMSNYRGFAWNDFRYPAIEVRIGLALYKAEHGRYPETLDDIETYLGKMPLDPYTDEPFRYRLEGDEYVFYSLGPDRIDNGGPDKRKDKANLYEWYRYECHGDLKDLVFPSHLEPPPPYEEFIEQEGHQPDDGWSTEPKEKE